MRWRTIGIALLAYVIAGCGSGAQQGATELDAGQDGQGASEASLSGDVPNPCSLLTPSDVEQTLGMPVEEVDGPKPPDSDPNGLLCHWSGEYGSGDYVTLAVYSRADHCELVEQGHSQMGKRGTPVEGLGDKATWYDLRTNVNICMNNHGQPMSLFSFIEPPVSQADLAALAKIAVSRT